MNTSSIISFYENVVSFFSMIIDTGKKVWVYVNTPLGEINDNLPQNWVTDIGDWLVGPFADSSILEIGLGSGLLIFMAVSLFKFFKLI